MTEIQKESKIDLIALYEDRIAARDFKTAIMIKLALAKLSGKPEPEPEQAPKTFNTQQAIVKYLVEQGWKANDSTLSLHVKQRKLLPSPDGFFTVDDVNSYASAHLINNPHRAEKNSADELILEAKQLENRRLRMKVEQQEGLLVNSEDVKRELENMLVSFRSRVLLIPRKLSSQLSQMDDQHQIEAVLARELRDSLTTLSQYHTDPTEAAE